MEELRRSSVFQAGQKIARTLVEQLPNLAERPVLKPARANIRVYVAKRASSQFVRNKNGGAIVAVERS